MAQKYGPNIVKDGLILNLDAADVNSYPGPTSVDVMVVGGGGGGGMDMGGGGGGGGIAYQQNYSVTPGSGITVTVGAGGWGAPAGSGGYRGDGVGPQPGGHQFTIPGTEGGNSVFGSITAYGGGHGGSSYYGYLPDYGYGANGGSGGGASGYTAGGTRPGGTPVSGQGYRGGASGGGAYYAGGGGGAGGAGADGPNKANGGPGICIPEMSPYYFGGGGGGATYSGASGGDGGIGGGGGGAIGVTVGGAGINNGSPGGGGSGGMWANKPGGNAGANTGGGGGGGSHYNATNQGGNGGSGIVIVRYKGPQGATGGDIIESKNGYTYHTFLSSGTFTPGGFATWYDTSGNGYNFNIVAGAYNSSGPKYMDFNGSYGCAKRTSDINITAATGITYVVWTRPKASTAEWRTLTRGYANDHHVIIQSGGYLIGMYDNDNVGFLSSGFSQTSLPNWGTSNWICMYWRWQASSPYYLLSYNDTPGTIRGSITNSNAYYNRGFGSIGAYHNGSTDPSVSSQPWGDIGSFLCYNRSLTDAELLQIYNATKTRFGL